jgi:hypothetical protein
MPQRISKTKRLILPTFLAISSITTIVLLGFRWLFDIQFHVVHFKLELWEIGIPVFLPPIAILILLRPKINRLTFSSDDARARTTLLIVSWLAISTPLVLAQQNLTLETGNLTKINSTKEIPSNSNARFIRLDNFVINPRMRGKNITVRQEGRRSNRAIKIEVYFVVPMFDGVAPKSLADFDYWCGLKFSKTLPADLPAEIYHQLYTEFINECDANTMRYPFHDANYFTNLPESGELDNYREAIRSKTRLLTSGTNVLIPNLQPFAKRARGSAYWSIVSFVLLHLLFFALLEWWPTGISTAIHRKL